MKENEAEKDEHKKKAEWKKTYKYHFYNPLHFFLHSQRTPPRSTSHSVLSRPSAAIHGTSQDPERTPQDTRTSGTTGLQRASLLSGSSPHLIPIHTSESLKSGTSTVPRHSQNQPLLSTDLPRVQGSSTHKYYTLKINTTRQSNESFV